MTPEQQSSEIQSSARFRAPFCFNVADGIIQAGPLSVRGKDTRTLKDASGKAFGDEIFKAAQDGKVKEVSYMFPTPGATDPSPKTSFVTKVGDLGCANPFSGCLPRNDRGAAANRGFSPGGINPARRD